MTDAQICTGCYVWKLSNGAFVHTVCREPYQKGKGAIYPSIQSAIYQGYPMSRFQLCAHCQVPIWDKPQEPA